MSDYDTIKSIFKKAHWSVKESISIEEIEEGEPITLRKLQLGNYYGMDIYFDINGNILEES